MKSRFADIANLNADALRAVRRDGVTLELDYAPDAAERVREFVRLEQECCAFLSFNVDTTLDLVQVRKVAPPQAEEAAGVIFDQFSSREIRCREACCS